MSERIWKSVFIWIMLIALIGLACNAPASSTPTVALFVQMAPTATSLTQGEQPAGPESSQTFLDVTYTPHNASKIILMSVEPDMESNIQRIVFMLPEALNGTDIFANGIKIDPAMGEGNVYILDLAGKVTSPDIELIFKAGSSEEQLAQCVVHAVDLLNPTGDCVW